MDRLGFADAPVTATFAARPRSRARGFRLRHPSSPRSGPPGPTACTPRDLVPA